AIGPRREILLGCSNAGKGSVIINELDGSLVRNLPGLNGSDEVWYNPGDNHYFLAESNHTGGPILGVADQSADNGNEDTSATTATGSHSVAADPVKNQVTFRAIMLPRPFAAAQPAASPYSQPRTMTPDCAAVLAHPVTGKA